MEDDLPTFIRSLAPDDVGEAIRLAARLFGAKPGAVKAWLYRERSPHPRRGMELVRKSGGRMSLQSIYGEDP